MENVAKTTFFQWVCVAYKCCVKIGQLTYQSHSLFLSKWVVLCQNKLQYGPDIMLNFWQCLLSTCWHILVTMKPHSDLVCIFLWQQEFRVWSSAQGCVKESEELHWCHLDCKCVKTKNSMKLAEMTCTDECDLGEWASLIERVFVFVFVRALSICCGF